LRHFMVKCRKFAKTGSGQANIVVLGKTRKQRDPFSRRPERVRTECECLPGSPLVRNTLSVVFTLTLLVALVCPEPVLANQRNFKCSEKRTSERQKNVLVCCIMQGEGPRDRRSVSLTRIAPGCLLRSDRSAVAHKNAHKNMQHHRLCTTVGGYIYIVLTRCIGLQVRIRSLRPSTLRIS
jgi:hypothetical protein